MTNPSTPDEPDKYNRPFSPSERRILKAMAFNLDDYNRTLNKESKEVKYLKNATGVASETPSSGESLASRKLASDAQNHYYDNLKFPEFVTPSNELDEIIQNINSGCLTKWELQNHPNIIQAKQQLQAWSDQRCIDAQRQLLEKLTPVGHWTKIEIEEELATLTPNERKAE